MPRTVAPRPARRPPSRCPRSACRSALLAGPAIGGLLVGYVGVGWCFAGRRRRAGRRHRAVRRDAALPAPGPQTTPPSLARHRRGHALRRPAPRPARHLPRRHRRDAAGDAGRAVPGAGRGRASRRPELLGLLYTAETVGSAARHRHVSGWTVAGPPPRPGDRGRRGGVRRRHRAGRPGAEHLAGRWPASSLAGAADMVSGIFRGDDLEPDHPRRACAAGWPASRCCPTPSARSAARSAPAWSPTVWAVRGLDRQRRRRSASLGVAVTAASGCATSGPYDARTDEHAVRERAVRAAHAEN